MRILRLKSLDLSNNSLKSFEPSLDDVPIKTNDMVVEMPKKDEEDWVPK